MKNLILLPLLAWLCVFAGIAAAQSEPVVQETEKQTEKAPPAPPLVKRVYRVPVSLDPVFRQPHSSSESADPFADLPKKPALVTLGIQELFESVGVSFEGDAFARLDKSKKILTVLNNEDQLSLVEAYLDSHESGSEKQVHIYLEYIEVNHSDFSDWIFENVMDSDGTELRNEVQSWIKEGRAEIIESATVVARSGQRAKVESVDEYIYPTEYNSPSIPNEVTLKGGAKAPIQPVSPTGFETRNLGVTLEVDPVLGTTEDLIDLNLAPEVVRLKGVEHWHNKTDDPRFQTHFPTFYTMKITTQVVAVNGRYAFLGTTRPMEAADPERKDPLVLQFVRGDVASLGEWSVIE